MAKKKAIPEISFELFEDTIGNNQGGSSLKNRVLIERESSHFHCDLTTSFEDLIKRYANSANCPRLKDHIKNFILAEGVAKAHLNLDNDDDFVQVQMSWDYISDTAFYIFDYSEPGRTLIYVDEDSIPFLNCLKVRR